MTPSDLQDLLAAFSDLTILVVGDFFLDRYLEIDPRLAETSIETGLPANQVVSVRNQPGAAGTVTNNLTALGVGRVVALGIIGEDGHGYDLDRALRRTGVDVSHLIRSTDRMTPTYTKPLLTTTGEERERLDFKNRSPCPADLEAVIEQQLNALVPEADGIIVLDQVQEADCGVITSRMRDVLVDLGDARPDLPILADSRAHIDAFRSVTVKPNEEEARSAASGTLEEAARFLSERNGRPVLVTLGEAGILVADAKGARTIPGIPVPPPVDIVGAGDSVSASVVAALAAGASLDDAAHLGVIVSSITVQQIGTTGTATPEEVLERFRQNR